MRRMHGGLRVDEGDGTPQLPNPAVAEGAAQ